MDTRYSNTAVALHWLVAALITCNLVLGVSMAGLPISPRKLEWYLVHKSIGLTVFLLTGARLVWRLTHPPPPPVAMPAWQRRSAAITHGLLYVLMFAIPISGWVYSSATGVEVVYLGLVPLPDLVHKSRALADELLIVHITLNSMLVLLVCLHVVAALKHHFVDRDPALARMLPRIGGRVAAVATVAIVSGIAIAMGAPAYATGVDSGKSEIAFSITQMGVRFDGRFDRWRGDIDFRPDAPGRSTAAIDVDLASVDLASDDSDAAARGPLWLDTAKYPVARFRSTSITADGANRYRVAGRLTLKGITRDCVVPILVTTDAAGTRTATGAFFVKRLQYHVGEGEWADPATVADGIEVRIRMVLVRSGADAASRPKGGSTS